MTTISVTDARTRLYKLVDQACQESEPILITGKRGSVVLVSEDDWRAIQETLRLLEENPPVRAQRPGYENRTANQR